MITLNHTTTTTTNNNNDDSTTNTNRSNSKHDNQHLTIVTVTMINQPLYYSRRNQTSYSYDYHQCYYR